MYYKSKLLYQIVEDNRLIDRMQVSLKLLQTLSKQQRIEIKDLIVILGISKQGFYKLNKRVQNKVFINLNKELSNAKEIVNMIKLEFKYLLEYGDGFYDKKELKIACKRWDITVQEFLKYLHSNPKHYKFNLQVLKNNKRGFWVGKVTQLSNSFITKNYGGIHKKCKKFAGIICQYYHCYSRHEEFMSVAFEKIIQIGGTVEKNFTFNKELQLNILGVKGKYAIINYYHKYCKDLYYEQILIDNEMNEDRLDFLADNTYNPEKVIENKYQEVKKLIEYEVQDMHKQIFEEVNNNLELFGLDRKQALKMIADKLGITEKELEKNICEMQNIILKNKTVKKCTNGTYIPMYDIEE
jgi:hypothetical protein